MRHKILLVLISCFTLTSFGQEKSAEQIEAAKPEQEEAAPEKEKKTKKEKFKKEKVPFRFMANVHGGIGLMNYFGDIRDNTGTTVHRIGSHAGFNFGIGGSVTNYLDVNVNVLMGKLTWNQNPFDHVAPKNFEAEVFTAGAELVYNFRNVIHSPVGITPFISVGVSYSDYDVYSDLQGKDRNGNTADYYYWDGVENRGLIYNLPQSTANPDDVTTLTRDFEYETRLNEFPITAVTIPVGAGFDFNASRKFAVRLGAYYYFSTTDQIDNVSGGDNGFFSNDGFLYTSMSVIFKFDPFKKKAPKVDVAGPEYLDLGLIVDEDSDGDGVSDLVDRCSGTPKGLSVDENGCPADGDNDGIPDYKDKELKTPSGSMVDANGVALSYQNIYKSYGSDTTSLLRKQLDKDWLFSQKEADPTYTVHVGTYTNYDIPTQIKMRLAKMEDLVELKVNDSLSVFTLGSFNNFEDAQKKQNELLESGIDEAFSLNQGVISSVGKDLGAMKVEKANQQPEGASLDIENPDVLSYGVELREYRLRIELDRLSKLIAIHGVEMKTTDGGMKVYTIGSFSTLSEAESLQEEVSNLGVKNPSITAKFNNATISIEDAKKKEDELKAAGNE